MSGNEDWKIPSSGGCCSRCGEPLRPASHVTAVLELADEGPRRLDLCETCTEQGAPTGSFFWRHQLPEGGRVHAVVDYGMLREVLERLLERPGEVYRRLCYLVALVLVRKRQLRLKSFEVRERREVMVVSRGAGHDDLVVPAPYLSADDLVDTRELLMRLMAADLPEGDLAEFQAEVAGRGRDGPAAGEAPGDRAQEQEATADDGVTADDLTGS
ncbi:MAG: hypothetical protein H6825_03695 [Planctomycetes bacterium]|nr:hypothetical protein [Planctomycetota bacterium]